MGILGILRKMGVLPSLKNPWEETIPENPAEMKETLSNNLAYSTWFKPTDHSIGVVLLYWLGFSEAASA